MSTKEPISPPPKPRYDHPLAEDIVSAAISWRYFQTVGHGKTAARYLDQLADAIDKMVYDLDHPPTSPPPPRKQ